MKVLTEADLRTEKVSAATEEYHVKKDVFVTPLAREYLWDRRVRLVVDEDAKKTMTRTPIKKQGNHTYVNALTGEGYGEKPEDMTHLRGNLLVPKTHPRIALRGEIDGLMAQVLLLQAKYPKEKELSKDLDSVLAYLHAILGAEVKDEVLGETLLFGLNHRELRSMSHDVKGTFGIDHPIPDGSMGMEALELNLLRTQVRKTELCAANAFPEGDTLGLIQHLNRLSSGIYILFCRKISGYYERMKGEHHE